MVGDLLHDILFRALWRCGYELKRIDADGWSPENLRKQGMNPATIIDVGVGTGTPGLHDAFPSARHVFIEPLSEFRPQMEALTKRYPGEYHLVAAGALDSESTINVDKRIPMQSSFSDRTADRSRRTQQRSVPVVRVDTLAQRCGWPAPYGLKIDTEGFECHVVCGATEVLRHTQFVIAELSIAEKFDDECSFAQFVSLMQHHNLRLCDILASPKSREKELIQIDAMFRPIDQM